MVRPPVTRIAHLLLVVSVIACAFVAGCAPSIGDSCTGSLDCSINGDRQCDTTRVGGACTVFGCEPDTCPDDSVCVRFRPEPSRLTFTACMRACEQDGNCRFDDGYRCVAADDDAFWMGMGNTLAENIDIDRGPDRNFCVATEAPE